MAVVKVRVQTRNPKNYAHFLVHLQNRLAQGAKREQKFRAPGGSIGQFRSSGNGSGSVLGWSSLRLSDHQNCRPSEAWNHHLDSTDRIGRGRSTCVGLGPLVLSSTPRNFGRKLRVLSQSVPVYIDIGFTRDLGSPMMHSGWDPSRISRGEGRPRTIDLEVHDTSNRREDLYWLVSGFHGSR